MRCAYSESSRNSTLFKQEVARGEVSTSRSRRGSEVFKLVDRRYSFPNAGVANHHGSSQLHAVNASSRHIIFLEEAGDAVNHADGTCGAAIILAQSSKQMLIQKPVASLT